MSEHDFIKAVAKEAGLTQIQTKELLRAMTNVIQRAISNDDTVKIVGLGRFYPMYASGREVFMPGTDEKVQIAPYKYCKFRMSNTFKGDINEYD